jgi:hypothetical protein
MTWLLHFFETGELSVKFLGKLVSGEKRYIVLTLEVLPLPLLPDGSLPAPLEGEELVGLEFAYASMIGKRELLL